MKPTLVVSIRSGIHYDVYIGRGSRWGNPFSHRPSRFDTIRVATREEAVNQHAKWIKTQPHLLEALPELRGKVLGCHCGEDQACHGHTGHTLADLADALS